MSFRLIGKVTANVEATPRSLATWMMPRINSTKRVERVRPRPLTPKRRVVDSWALHGAEAGLKPRAAFDWNVDDTAIVRALGGLRARTPRVRQCKSSMAALLRAFDQMSGKR